MVAAEPVEAKVTLVTWAEILATVPAVVGKSMGTARHRLMPSSSYTTGASSVRESGSPQTGSVQKSRHFPVAFTPLLI